MAGWFLPFSAAHLDGPSIAALICLAVIHTTVPKSFVEQLSGIDCHANALATVVNARTLEQLAANGELPNKVQFQVSIKMHGTRLPVALLATACPIRAVLSVC
jgi:hypothetical protein